MNIPELARKFLSNDYEPHVSINVPKFIVLKKKISVLKRNQRQLCNAFTVILEKCVHYKYDNNVVHSLLVYFVDFDLIMPYTRACSIETPCAP